MVGESEIAAAGVMPCGEAHGPLWLWNSLSHRLSPPNLRDQHNLALRAQLRRVRVLKDLAVDSHRHSLLNLLAQARVATVQLQDQATEGRRRHLELRLAAGEPTASVARDDDLRHQV